MAKHNSATADYIELSIANNEDNDDPPDHLDHDEETFDKEENYKSTTALLKNIEERGSSSSDDFLYEDGENKSSSKPKHHENSLAIQVTKAPLTIIGPLQKAYFDFVLLCVGTTFTDHLGHWISICR